VDIIRIRPHSQLGSAERFTGTVWIDEVAVASPPSRLCIYSVHFSPGARTAWHYHPFGQILHVSEGVGRVQRRHGPIEEVGTGGIIIAEPGEWHWHGAGPESFMTHLAIQEVNTDGQYAYWGSHVSDPEYSKDLKT
jgi:quercetin dioxygenase-like cupin family protein